VLSLGPITALELDFVLYHSVDKTSVITLVKYIFSKITIESE